jgi:hypothetical protein
MLIFGILDNLSQNNHQMQSSDNWHGSKSISQTGSRVRIQNIIVLGERNSGTRHLSRVLKRVFQRTYGRDYRSSILGYKHMYFSPTGMQQIINNTTETIDVREYLVQMAVRNVCDWVDGMYRKPHFRSDDKRFHRPILPPKPVELYNVSRLEFLTMPWHDYPTRTTMPNVLALRYQKLKFMKMIQKRFPLHNIVHFDDMANNATRVMETLTQLITRFQLHPGSDNYTLHGNINGVPHAHVSFSIAEAATVDRRLQTNQNILHSSHILPYHADARDEQSCFGIFIVPILQTHLSLFSIVHANKYQKTILLIQK